MENHDIEPKYILHNSLASSTSKLLNTMKLSEALDDVMIQYSQKMHDVATKGYVQYTLNIAEFKKQLKDRLIAYKTYAKNKYLLLQIINILNTFIENLSKKTPNFNQVMNLIIV